MVINPKENRCSYWNDNFVHGCPKNTFAMSFRKKEWKANFSNPATPSGLSYIRADFPWTFRKPTITQNFEKIFFFQNRHTFYYYILWRKNCFKESYYPNPKCSETSKRKCYSWMLSAHFIFYSLLDHGEIVA